MPVHFLTESSPRRRRKAEHADDAREKERVIPASAENENAASLSTTTATRHPRRVGERPSRLLRTVKGVGSSPHSGEKEPTPAKKFAENGASPRSRRKDIVQAVNRFRNRVIPAD